MIKLKKLHEGIHPQGCYNNYAHDSSKSLYGYKEYFIKTHYAYMGWNIYQGEKQINPILFLISKKYTFNINFT